MPFTSLTWNSGQVVSSTRLALMSANDVYFYNRYEQLLFVEEEVLTSTAGSYETKLTGYMYAPSGDYFSMTIYCELKSGDGNEVLMKVTFGGTSDSSAISTTATDYTAKSITKLKLPTAPNWFKFEVKLDSQAATSASVRGICAIISAE